jgi:hypothetical protein
VKLTIDVPDVDGLPCDIWVTLGKGGYEPYVVAFYNQDDANTVFERWWKSKQGEAKPKKKARP